MRISTKGKYGLRILLDLALHQDGAPRLTRDIAASQQISEKYISRLVIGLRRARMVRSIRGAKGGFRLSGNPVEITLLDVVEVMEGPLSIVDCVTRPEQCDRIGTCGARDIWKRLNDDIRKSMSKVTLQDIIDDCRRRNTTQEEYFDYCI